MHHTMFQHAEKVPTCKNQYSCNHYIQYSKRKFILMYHKISLHEENSILFLPPTNLICFDSSEKVQTCGKQYSCNHCIQYFKRKFVLMHLTMFQHVENSIFAIIAYKTSKENSFWCITKCPNMKKTVFFQSLHTIL